jgi:hypothetical protein
MAVWSRKMSSNLPKPIRCLDWKLPLLFVQVSVVWPRVISNFLAWYPAPASGESRWALAVWQSPRRQVHKIKGSEEGKGKVVALKVHLAPCWFSWRRRCSYLQWSHRSNRWQNQNFKVLEYATWCPLIFESHEYTSKIVTKAAQEMLTSDGLQHLVHVYGRRDNICTLFQRYGPAFDNVHQPGCNPGVDRILPKLCMTKNSRQECSEWHHCVCGKSSIQTLRTLVLWPLLLVLIFYCTFRERLHWIFNVVFVQQMTYNATFVWNWRITVA